jgi:hypothetical protein
VGGLFAAGAILAIAAWIGYRRRLARADERLSDDAIHQIETRGWVERDEPLDLDEAAREEENFWGESWDQPEPW